MNNKLSITYLILIIAPFFFSCRGPVKEQAKNNASPNSLSLHIADEKYVIIDTKQTVVTWKGSSPMGSHTGYVYISQGELMIENGQLVGGTGTIKGITHPVTFPVKMEMKDGIIKASGKLVIDRTLRDVRYKSGKFFDNLKDQAISDSIEFHIKIVATKGC
jgi:hypothetical protein